MATTSTAAAAAATAAAATAKQNALTALQNAIKAKTTGVGVVTADAAFDTASQTANNLINQATLAQMQATTDQSAANAAAAQKAQADALAAQQQAAAYQVQLAQAQSQLAQAQSQAAMAAANPNTSTDYISAAQQQLTNWGILNANDPNSTDLMNQITTLAQQGAQPDTIALTIQNSPAYKARFSGNDARVAAGFSAYSAADYMTAENNYRSILSESGVPDQYQTQSFLASLIGKNVGTTTLQNYVNMASQLATTQDPYLLQTAYQQYGLTQGDLIAHFLDPNTAVPVLQQQFAGTQIAAEAARQNLALNQQNALSLAAQGVTQQQAQTGFANIGSQLAQQQQIAASLGGNAANIGSELTAAQFNANVNGISAAQAQQELTRQRAGLTNLYSGSSGAGKGSLYTEQSGVS